ncbi:protein Fe65 homolog isoform X1 [Diorhabda carinulata]|uniref:protein Fe65 homolog isoform X2 n=1 Tax=Diorhabda sublineata TaxID=1163346 RepID=UPI0024E17B1A|nr:protein Fe65 homolog isoform X2 [Diorhabda sublineata]XP_056648210.1 protein Fe65 homolog isoform X2 [Diorhabda sublineata]XP_056648211.1 protein Fe65 homolog isoform X2 [Diorhabda sublineata]XP_057669491.1 protein Fe65 homolog isoform X1 [Diorhabda carinulata]XP_057669492.1 protein Fe65 homolog isoform X1 [Diorhabda carinulata]
MLCGEFHRAPIGLHLNSVFLSANPSPYCSLLTLVRGMAAITAQAVHEDEDIFLENGLLSYENPNYRLGPSTRLDDALNSNTENIYEDIYQELDDICNMGHGGKGSIATNASRKAYAALDITSMGVDINKGPVTQNYMDNRRGNEWNGNSLSDKDLSESSTVWENLFDKTVMTKEDENGIQHIVGSITNDLYAVPMRKCPKSLDQIDKLNSPDPEKEWDSQNELPPGWEKHEDNDGPYYWHIKSGTIQREIPIIENHKLEKSNSKLNLKESALISSFENNLSVTRSCTSSALNLESDDRKRKEEIALKRRSFPSKPDQDCKERPIRFAVRSLGWVEISEDDLTPERSSKAVNKCIVDLSLGRNDLLDVVGRWGDGKDLFMDLDEGSLKLFDPENLTVLNTQPIHTIRVWGVGRDNGRDFAYVARDRTTRKHMCHVFRCDMPARTIANTLRDICKKIMIERSLQQNLGKAIDVNGKSLATRPNNLPTEHRRPARNSQIFVSQSFPTPMEEPKKILRAQYLGCTQVAAATGMDVLNESIDRLMTTVPPEQWQPVNISIAPSMISIHHPNDERVLAECRVRYLSFLGIGKIIKHCAFIMHTAQDTFMSHVFYCEPSSGALCKTIEAACKLRYQKCLDAHPQGLGNPSTNVHTPGSSIGAALKSIVGSLRGRKSKSAES